VLDRSTPQIDGYDVRKQVTGTWRIIKPGYSESPTFSSLDSAFHRLAVVDLELRPRRQV
jgi:hypothetical protein